MTSNPTPTPLASTAMEAARAVFEDLYIDCGTPEENEQCMTDMQSILCRHFQPLLAKVEEERDALKHRVLELEGFNRHIQFQHDIRVKDADALRADLAAKEAAQTEMKEYLRNMAHKLNAVLGLNERECEYLNRLQEQDDMASALASRADKGGAT